MDAESYFPEKGQKCFSGGIRVRLLKILAIAAVFALGCANVTAHAQCVVPNTISNGQTADASQVMGNFNALNNCINSAPAGSANAVQVNGGSGTFAGVGPLTNGQLVIGSTGAAPQPATLTAGAGISITNGPGSITITAGGGGAITLISTTTLATAATSVTISVPSGYNNLELKCRAGSTDTSTTTSDSLGIQFNSDTGADYAYQQNGVYGNGAGFNYDSGSTNSIPMIFLPSTGIAFPTGQFDVFIDGVSLASVKTVNFKVTSWQGNVGSVQNNGVGFWNQAATINSITLSSGGFEVAAGMTCWLYGM